MTRTIWKFPFEITDRFGLEMPREAQVLAVQAQFGQPCLWVEVDPTAKKERRFFRVFGTGHDIPVEMGLSLAYIGTFQMPPFVWHLYEHE